MFEVYCPAHRSRVLLAASRIESLRNTPDGPILDWRCWCGARGSLVRGVSRVHRHGPSAGPTSDVA
ncbi:MAG TPA: hypothetical protein VIL48_05540 [Acidimicrobiales bacterium]